MRAAFELTSSTAGQVAFIKRLLTIFHKSTEIKCLIKIYNHNDSSLGPNFVNN